MQRAPPHGARSKEARGPPALSLTAPPTGTFLSLFHRRCAFALVLVSSSALSLAQSPVKPLPAAALPSSLAVALAAPSALPVFDQHWPRSPFDEVAHLPASDDGPHFDLALLFDAQKGTEFQGAPGSVRTLRGGWDAHVGWRTGERSGLSLNLHQEASFYSFTNATGLVPGSGSDAPFNDVYETSIGSTLCVAASERTSWVSSAALTFAGEDNAALGKSLSVCMLTGLRYRVRDDVTIEGGLAAVSLLEDDPWLVPYVGFDWDMGAGWRLSASGPRVEFSKELGREWTLGAIAQYEVRQYRLNASNPLPDGVLRDQQIDLGLEIAWRPQPDTRLSIEGGMVGWRELQFLDRDGNKVSETEADPAPFASLRLHFGF